MPDSDRPLETAGGGDIAKGEERREGDKKKEEETTLCSLVAFSSSFLCYNQPVIECFVAGSVCIHSSSRLLIRISRARIISMFDSCSRLCIWIPCHVHKSQSLAPYYLLLLPIQAACCLSLILNAITCISFMHG